MFKFFEEFLPDKLAFRDSACNQYRIDVGNVRIQRDDLGKILNA